MLPPGLVTELLPSWLDPATIIGDYGLVIVLVILFAECGLLVGFFFPGDSLLFTLGLFIARGDVNQPLWLACVLTSIAAIAGNQVGYHIGKAAGPRIFNRPDSRLFRREYVDKTNAFFERYGARAIVLARFVPIVRTFITVVAGASKMDPKKFFLWTGIGAVLWATGITLLGHALGNVEFIHNNLETALILLVLISLIPMVVEYLLARRRKRNAGPDAGAPKHAAPKHPITNHSND
jgi:membrane-associated protein